MKDAILIVGGAFNPVHTQHIALLCHAKQELEANGEWNIIGGYLAVATDNYVLHKLHSRNERTIKLKHRLALVNEAMQDIPWLINSPFQAEMLKQHDGSAFALGQRVQCLLKNDNIQIMILIGGDRMVKKGIGRIMDENINLFELWQDDLDKNRIPNPKEYILLNIPIRPVSSTLARIHLNRWFTAKDDSKQQAEIENDLININCYLHSSVMNYIKTHKDDLYI